MLLLPTAGDISMSPYLCDFSILAHVSFRLTDRLNTSLLSAELLFAELLFAESGSTQK